ncbi:hypothetical protein OG783_06245 [Streptomyces jietaisiensis]|uniref:hypothetical protein n=1 Tax=Streptomyces griseoaurantiacus TaxID=68213 RepID=UPI00324DA3EC
MSLATSVINCRFQLGSYTDQRTDPSVGLGTARTDSSGNTSSDGGGWGWLKGPLDSIKNYGSAIISQPDIWIGGAETVGSIFLMGFGGDFALGGTVACLTGVGCVLGGPVAVGGVGLASIGAAGASDGVGRINDGLGRALREADGAGGGGEGVTVTDEEGLAAAKAAAKEFKEPGGTNGALYVEGYDDSIAISSGSGNLPKEYVRPPGANTSNYHHAEAQAASLTSAFHDGSSVQLAGRFGVLGRW